MKGLLASASEDGARIERRLLSGLQAALTKAAAATADNQQCAPRSGRTHAPLSIQTLCRVREPARSKVHAFIAGVCQGSAEACPGVAHLLLTCVMVRGLQAEPGAGSGAVPCRGCADEDRAV